MCASCEPDSIIDPAPPACVSDIHLGALQDGSNAMSVTGNESDGRHTLSLGDPRTILQLIH
jgi:hypothetical protein